MPRRLFASGLCFGVALLMKQHAVFFAAYAGGLVLWRELRCAAGAGHLGRAVADAAASAQDVVDADVGHG